MNDLLGYWLILICALAVIGGIRQSDWWICWGLGVCGFISITLVDKASDFGVLEPIAVLAGLGGSGFCTFFLAGLAFMSDKE